MQADRIAEFGQQAAGQAAQLDFGRLGQARQQLLDDGQGQGQGLAVERGGILLSLRAWAERSTARVTSRLLFIFLVFRREQSIRSG